MLGHREHSIMLCNMLAASVALEASLEELQVMRGDTQLVAF